MIGDKYQFSLPVKVYGGGERHGDGAIAPMAGKVVKVSVSAKQKVKKGDPLIIMEAMKMEHVIRANVDGIVEQVLFATGDFVDGGKVLVTFAAKPAPAAAAAPSS
jgi:3-methylcrotonyl-CoA carboxylase alpha subunit